MHAANTDRASLQARTAKGFAILSLFFFLFIIPVERLASREYHLVCWAVGKDVMAAD